MAQPSPSESSLHFLDYWRVIRSRKEIVISVALLVLITGAAYTFALPWVYTADARISIREDATDVDVFDRQMGSTYNPFFLRTQLEIIKSRQIMYQVINNLDLQKVWGRKLVEDKSPLPREVVYRMLQGSVSVEPARDTSLVVISCQREDPQEASQIANEVATVYRDTRLTNKKREVSRGLEGLRTEIEKQQEKVNQAENEMEKIRQDLNISVSDQGVKLDEGRLAQMQGDRVSARVDMLTRKARLDQLKEMKDDALINAAAYVVSDNTLMALRSQINDSEVMLKTLLENYGPNHPEVKKVQAGLEEMKLKQKEALKGMIVGLEADYNVTKTRYEELDHELTEQRRADIQMQGEKYLPFFRAQRNVEIQRSILNALKSRLTQTGIEISIPRTPVEIIDVAEPPTTPSGPKRALYIILSLLLGIVAGVGLAYLLEYLDTSVKTVDDVERNLELPVLGVIPQKVRPLIEEGPKGPHAEVYRVLKTNIQFATKDTQSKCFVCISGGAGEGKSTTIFNTAYVFAEGGDRVLIVDSDLRRPVQHTIMGLSSRVGLTDVLLRDLPIEDAIKESSVPNLHLLPSGSRTSSHSNMLAAQRLRELIRNLKEKYDYIFFDSPPILSVTDASILASEIENIIMVIQYRKYPKNVSLRAKRMIESAGGRILGVVLNNINIMRDDYYYYYYYSYYHKGYGYHEK